MGLPLGERKTTTGGGLEVMSRSCYTAAVNHPSGDFNQAVEHRGLEFRGVVQSEEMCLGAVSMWIVYKALRLDA